MSQFDKTDVSVALYEFKQLYSAYCSKKGYTEIADIESPELEIFEKFKMSIQ